MKKLIVAASLVSALALTACAGRYALMQGEPQAVLEFEKGYDKGASLGASTLQSYTVARGRCDVVRPAASFTWIDGAMKTRTVGAGQLVHIEALTNRYTSGFAPGLGVVLNTRDCNNVISFVPQSGARYRVVQRVAVAQACRMEVRSLDVGVPDPQIAIVSKDDCRK